MTREEAKIILENVESYMEFDEREDCIVFEKRLNDAIKMAMEALGDMDFLEKTVDAYDTFKELKTKLMKLWGKKK